jgi:AraC-like DNA-binding protein
MPMLETAVRGAAFGLLALLAVLLLRDGRRMAAARLGAVFAAGAASALISAAPAFDGETYPWLLPFQLLNAGNPVVFWLLASALFDDAFRLRWPHGLAWIALAAIGFWSLHGGGGAGFLAYKAGDLTCLLAAMAQAAAGRAGDLVEARRTLRVRFVVVVGLFTVAIVTSAVFLHGGRSTPAFGYTDAIGNLVIGFYFAMTLLTLEPGGWLAPLAASAPIAARLAPPADPQEAGLLERLNRLMQTDRAYREENLSIAALAGRLGIPEYRLRRLINQRLGHRNFAAFLNGYRLGDAEAALADPSQDEVSILTIALDAGFASIGVFNRAFKARTGVTPTEFRRTRSAAI